ncbi:MAG: hypothetical protein PHI41_02100 [Erysipelotrichaceae bacterium]|nr:hypothetical protein [Erysipelotrichaceae bacterium]MDD3809069.1 hypothetical protein [Erysipelotrichaceae bacterium]
MENIYLEQTVKGPKKIHLIISRNLFISLALLFFVLSAFLFYFILGAILMILLAIWSHNSNKIEYDYTVFNRDFEIAQVTNSRKRKTVFRANLDDLVALSHNKNTIACPGTSHKSRTMRFIGASDYELVYLLFQANGERISVITQLNEELARELNPKHSHFFTREE